VLRLLDQLPLVGHDVLYGAKELGLALRAERKAPSHPGTQLGRGARVASLRWTVSALAQRILLIWRVRHRRDIVNTCILLE
jgi:hypothetical protein